MFVCLFVLRFYGPVNPMGSCRARSVYLTKHLLVWAGFFKKVNQKVNLGRRPKPSRLNIAILKDGFFGKKKKKKKKSKNDIVKFPKLAFSYMFIVTSIMD